MAPIVCPPLTTEIPLMERVAELAWELFDNGKPITVTGILDILDEENDYSKKEYKLWYSRIYGALRKSQYFGFLLWTDYTKTEKYRADFKATEYYFQNVVQSSWRDNYFKTLYDLGIFSRQQMEDSIIEARLFHKYLKLLKKSKICFVIAGRGISEFRTPNYHDFCFYKYRNLLASAKMAEKQIEDMRKAELMLPEGVLLPRIEDLMAKMSKALEYTQSVDDDADDTDK